MRHRPDGPCDDSCGCSSRPTSKASEGDTAVPLPPTAAAEPIACTLDAGSMATRLAEWQTLMRAPSDGAGADVTTVEIDGGIRLEFSRGIDVAELARLAEAEQDCCRFFAFSITVDQRGVGLEVRAGDEPIDVVRTLFGVPA